MKKFLLLVLLFSAASVRAEEWKASGSHPVKLVKGERVLRLWMTVFKEQNVAMKVIDQGDSPRERKYESLKVAMMTSGALAGTNGGFFQKDFRPMGLTICDGVKIGAFSSTKLLSGVLFSKEGTLQLVRREAFQDDKKITQLLQAGPFLVEKGAAVTGLHAGDARARTFICTDGAGNWALCVLRSASLRELGEILVQPGLISGIKVHTALNLDGGSSSGYWAKEKDGKAVYSTEWTRVRNFLAFVPK